MLALYHGANSVCSIKVRIVLAEKGLEWESRHIDLPKGEQFSPEFLKVNPAAIVPVLDHDGRLVHESSVISEYVDTLTGAPLMPADAYAQARTRVWGILTLDYHDSVNTLTFASYQRQMLLSKSPEELAARWDAMPNKIRARKAQDLLEKGAASEHLPVATARLRRMCEMMEADLDDCPWLLGAEYSLADALLTGYFFRIECIGLAGIWSTDCPRTTEWYARVKARPSLAAATDPWLDASARAAIRAAGHKAYAGTPLERYLT